MMRRIAAVVLGCGAAWGQAFEVASVKEADPRAPSKVSGGPGSADPGRWSCTRCSLFALVTQAYAIFEYQVVAPDWARSGAFEVEAKIPPGATRDQFRVMLQQLLADRFKLVAHHENREMPVYELLVAKGEMKMTDTSEGPPPPPPPASTSAVDRDGFPNFPSGTGILLLPTGRGRMQFRQQTMKNVAHWLSVYVDRPVVDATGLTGKYALTLSWYRETPGTGAAPEGPDIFRALQEQLGLKLEPKKGTIEMVVVDKADRKPVEN